MRAWLALPNFRGQARFSTWSYRIVTNLCYNRLPRLRKDLSALGDESLSEIPDEAAPPHAQLESEERRTFLQSAIEQLPESYKLLIKLRFQQELSFEEIATITSLPLGTVKTGIFRARARLRQISANTARPRFRLTTLDFILPLAGALTVAAMWMTLTRPALMPSTQFTQELAYLQL